MLQRLALASGGIYALGSGILAMADVARGALGGFVNIITNLWDVAAGEVLVRACGGKVTTFEGSPIEYTSANQISVIAAKGHLYKEIYAHLLGHDPQPSQQKRGKALAPSPPTDSV
jgi:fructose-1,6-bisphosphatase/inositol monophosphatase family enzyme